MEMNRQDKKDNIPEGNAPNVVILVKSYSSSSMSFYDKSFIPFLNAQIPDDQFLLK